MIIVSTPPPPTTLENFDRHLLKMLEIASGELPGHVRLLQLPSVEVEVHVRYSSD